MLFLGPTVATYMELIARMDFKRLADRRALSEAWGRVELSSIEPRLPSFPCAAVADDLLLRFLLTPSVQATPGNVVIIEKIQTLEEDAQQSLMIALGPVRSQPPPFLSS